jgi:NAD(P)-dependent dehydrogenase (short-subunit alcohol dehydrogenase family)
VAVERFGGWTSCSRTPASCIRRPSSKLEETDFDRVLAVNLKSYFLFGQAAAPAWSAERRRDSAGPA